MPAGVPDRPRRKKGAAARPLLVSEPKQLAALVSPVRQEIVDVLAAAGPSTMAQLAEWLGRPADTLYYHVAALCRAGLLVEAGRQRTGRRFGALYDVAGRPVRLRPKGSKAPQTIQRTIRASLRMAERDLARAVERLDARAGADSSHAPPARIEGDGRNIWAGRAKGWVDAEDLKKVGALMNRLLEVLAQGAPRPGAHAQSFTFVLVPVTMRAARRGSSPVTPRSTRRAARGANA